MLFCQPLTMSWHALKLTLNSGASLLSLYLIVTAFVLWKTSIKLAALHVYIQAIFYVCWIYS